MQFPSLSANELELFRACLAWSNKECHRRSIAVSPENQRDVLGSVLFHIRFPTMSLVEFAQDVSKTNVLTADDRCAVFEYIACRGDACHCNKSGVVNGADSKLQVTTVKVELTSRLRFPTTRRKSPLPSVLSRFTTFCKSGIYSNDSSMMRLCVDRQVVLRGFGVSGSVSPCDPLHEVAVSMKQDKQVVCNPTLSVCDHMTGRSSELFDVFVQNKQH